MSDEGGGHRDDVDREGSAGSADDGDALERDDGDAVAGAVKAGDPFAQLGRFGLEDGSDAYADDRFDEFFGGGARAPRGRRGGRRERHRRRSRRAQRRDRPHRVRTTVLLLMLVVAPLGALVYGYVWLRGQLDPAGEPGEAVVIEVEAGWGVRQIADELSRRDVIGSSFVFQVYTEVKGAGPFQAGAYDMRRDLGVRPAIEILEQGPKITYVDLAVPPGLRLSEIARRVGELPGRSAEEFLDVARSGAVRSKYQPEGSTNLEGLLFPDTYRVSDSEDELDILQRMVEQFDQVADDLGLDRAQDEGRTRFEAYEIVVIASLIQSEAKLDEERALIASVIDNRLKADMLLQIDATVLYANHTRAVPITQEQLDKDSPYNTYRVKGLPPTPISTVTRVSLEAASSPAESPFFYYVLAGEDGHHAFAQTYEEHEVNVQAAREAGLL